MGYAFTYPLFKYVGHCKIASYVHYPTITSDMLKRVSGRVPSYNNRPTVANSPFLTAGKLIYYKIFAWVSLMNLRRLKLLYLFLNVSCVLISVIWTCWKVLRCYYG